ncbi:hypothetical protein VZ95_20545 [Elstera litoralis]|uniref:Calcium-binding protein n=3 Tax=Elstera litoralis TaxID=552518 RepID=A0A0F3IJ36_9PROT|nr:hypothetical protein VZ95_20545 [Elstera litoralis]
MIMAQVSEGSEGADYIDRRFKDPGEGNDGDNIQGLGGNDTILGGDGRDHISGGTGNDSINGGMGDDYGLNGDEGNDTIHGGHGVDWIYGGSGADLLYGDAGSNYLLGGSGDDIYVHSGNDGFTFISDVYANGGGTDIVYFLGTTLDQLQFQIDGNDLYLYTVADTQDGTIDNGIAITNFFLGGDYLIEYVADQNGTGLDLGAFFGMSMIG